MGGLVARAALPRISAKVLGVVHCVQPAVGAVAAARRFMTGYQPSVDGQLGEYLDELVRLGEAIPAELQAELTQLRTSVGEPVEEGFVTTRLMTALFSDSRILANPLYYGRLMSVLPGAVELLPSTAAGIAEPTWLRPHVPPPPIDIFEAYKHLPFGTGGGLVNPGLSATERAQLNLRLDEAKAFYAGLTYHPVTGVLSGTGKKTDTALDPALTPPAVISRAGDGTVPDFSARCPDLATPIFRVSIPNVNHGECFQDRAFRNAVIAGVDHILRGKAALREGVLPAREPCLQMA
jgi:hypothetical protein